jgi:hypothetical protein
VDRSFIGPSGSIKFFTAYWVTRSNRVMTARQGPPQYSTNNYAIYEMASQPGAPYKQAFPR